MHTGTLHRKTILSPCRSYRYVLWREFNELIGQGYAMFIGLNPSTADETSDDATIRRCIGYAKSWGYGAMCMTNLFAFRATKPEDMMTAVDPVGADNDQHLLAAAQGAGVIVAAWGTHGEFMGRDATVRNLIPGLHCLALTKGGHPHHPLRLRADLIPVPYR